MAFCSNCGARLYDGMKFCPECGTQCETEPAPIPMRIYRKKKGAGMALPVEVYIDGEFIESLKYGDSVTISIYPGEHHILMNMRTAGENTDMFSIPDNATFARYVFGIEGLQCIPTRVEFFADGSSSRDIAPVREAAPVRSSSRRTCPKCGGDMMIQTVTESRKSGCGTILLYIILALTIFGLLIVIPLALRKKTETVTYAVCQNCGYKFQISRR